MKTLTLPLKRKWFNMIRAGVKLEEYREIGKYWAKRLLKNYPEYYNKIQALHDSANGFKKFDKLIFTLGYPKANDTSRRLEFNNPKIRIGTGRPEWGAEPGKTYFIITWET
ncbi:MAG: hypothetical protein MJY89_06445 [Bacteroidales bacterium]|nr:hypothetical protein [Bacteroidales bacterium]